MAPNARGSRERRGRRPLRLAVAHRRLAWLAAVGGFERGLMAGWHAAVVAWSELLPLRRTEIALVRADPSDDRLYRIEPVVGGVAGLDLAMEAAARRFVRNLLAIDGATQTERFREAFKLMDDGFYARFAKERFARSSAPSTASSTARSRWSRSTASRRDRDPQVRRRPGANRRARRRGGRAEKAAGVPEHDGAAGRGLRGP